MSYHVEIIRTKAGQIDALTRDELVQAIASMEGRLALSENNRSEVQIYKPADGPASEVMYLDEGKLWVKNPSASFLATMIELAEKLSARVRGDEFETYRSPDETYEHPDDLELINARNMTLRRLIQIHQRRSWIVRALTIIGFLTTGLIYYLINL